ncbi:MAG: VanZ family protein [Nonomuraea sp.]|nr:VanZ family protein [Nonomuraea sp.]
MGVYQTNLAVAFILAPFFIVLGALPFISRQYRIFGRVGLWSGLVAAALVLYLCAIVAFTLFPLPDVGADPGAFCLAHAGTARPQLHPFASLDDIWQGVPGAFWQVFFNLLLFVPLGFFLRYRYGRSLAFSAVLGFAVSLTVEFTQLTGDWGLYPCPYRLFDVDDLLTNTAGTVIGFGLAVPLALVLPRAWPRPAPDDQPPGLVRRIVGNLLNLAVWWLAAVAVSIVLAITRVEFESDLTLYVVGVVVLLVIPLLRRDRSAPGRAAVHLALVDVATGRPAGRRAVLIRFAVFPLPFVVLSALERGLLVFLLAVAHLIVVLVRRDRRSLAGLAAGTATTTRAVALDDPPDALEFPERWRARL